MKFPFFKKKDEDEDMDLDGGEGKFPPEEEKPFPDTPFPESPTPPPIGQQPPGPAPSSFDQPSYPPPPVEVPKPVDQTQTHDKIEVIAAKIDSVRSQVEVLNQRIANIEAKLDRALESRSRW